MSSLLTQNMVSDTSNSNLILLMGADTLHVLVCDKGRHGDMLYRTLPIGRGGIDGDPTSAIEALVYDNPLLLSEFSSVTILADTPHAMFVPSALPIDVINPMLSDSIWVDESGQKIMGDNMSTGPYRLKYLLPERLVGFIGRTFHRCHVYHRLTPIAHYHGTTLRQQTGSRVCVHVAGERTDILGYKDGVARIVTTQETPTTDDLVYRVALAVREISGGDNADIYVWSSDAGQRSEAIEALRRFHTVVMPGIYPTDLKRYGSDVQRVPFEMASLLLMPQSAACIVPATPPATPITPPQPPITPPPYTP